MQPDEKLGEDMRYIRTYTSTAYLQSQHRIDFYKNGQGVGKMIWRWARVFGGLRTAAFNFGSGLRLASHNLDTLEYLIFNNVREAC